MMGSSVGPTNAQKAKTYVETHAEEMRAMLPSHIEQERFMRNMGRQLVGNRNLQDCDPSSLVTACVEAANLGLDIGTLGSCWIIPFGRQATLVVGYQGLIDLAIRSGTVKAIHCEVVRANDEYGANQRDFFHSYDPFALESERGQIIGTYCIIDLENGSSQYETMSVEQVEKVRSGSRAGGSGPWVDHWDRMAIKTVLRRALTKIKLSPEVREKMHDVFVREDGDPAGGSVTPAVGTALSLPETTKEEASVQHTVSEAARKTAKPRDARNWKIDTDRANSIAKEMGITGWSRLTDQRKKLILARQREEGINEQGAFWDAVHDALLPFDFSKIENWSSGKTLDTFMRIPQRGGADHFLMAKEGGYSGDGPEMEEPTALDQMLGGE